jgi:hypothetical protein
MSKERATKYPKIKAFELEVGDVFCYFNTIPSWEYLVSEIIRPNSEETSIRLIKIVTNEFGLTEYQRKPSKDVINKDSAKRKHWNQDVYIIRRKEKIPPKEKIIYLS